MSFLNSELVSPAGTLNLSWVGGGWVEFSGLKRQKSSDKTSVHCLVHSKLGRGPLCEGRKTLGVIHTF